VECIVNDGPNAVDGAAGRKSLELINAIYESIETGREVRLPDRAVHSRLGGRR
jgi:predicted dehydrogenase